MRTRGSRNSKDEITLRGIPESVIRTRQLGPNRDSPGHARELSKKNFRSTWRNWKGGLLTRYGHRCGPTCGHLFAIIFFDACTHSPSLSPPPLSHSLPSLSLPPCVRPIVITFAILHLRGFSIAHPLSHDPRLQFFSLAMLHAYTPICRDFVCNVSHLCNVVRVFSRMHYMRDGKLLFPFNGSQTNPRIFSTSTISCSARVYDEYMSNG